MHKGWKRQAHNPVDINKILQTILIHQWNYYISRQFNMRSKREFISNEKAINVKCSTLYHACLSPTQYVHWNWQGESRKRSMGRRCHWNVSRIICWIKVSSSCMVMAILRMYEGNSIFKNWIRCDDKLPGTGKSEYPIQLTSSIRITFIVISLIHLRV